MLLWTPPLPTGSSITLAASEISFRSSSVGSFSDIIATPAGLSASVTIAAATVAVTVVEVIGHYPVGGDGGCGTW